MMDDLRYYMYERLIEYEFNINHIMIGKFLGKLPKDRSRYFVRYCEYDDDESDDAISYNGIKFHRQVVEFVELIKSLYGRQRVYARLPKERKDIIECLLDSDNNISHNKITLISNIIKGKSITTEDIVAIKLIL